MAGAANGAHPSHPLGAVEQGIDVVGGGRRNNPRSVRLVGYTSTTFETGSASFEGQMTATGDHGKTPAHRPTTTGGPRAPGSDRHGACPSSAGRCSASP